MSEKSFNQQVDEIVAWVQSMPTDQEIRDGIIEECAANLAAWYPDNVSTNAFCAALRSMKGARSPQGSETP